MRVLAIVHQADAGPGVFAEAIAASGGELETWHVAGGAAPPSDPACFDAVLTLGGAMHADQEQRHPWLTAEKALLGELIEAGQPLLGVCLGSQLVAEAAGVRPRRAREPELGWHELELTAEGAADLLTGDLPQRLTAFQWHSYEVALPPGAVALASSPICLQAYRLGQRAWGIQFHAEVSAADAMKWIREYRDDGSGLMRSGWRWRPRPGSKPGKTSAAGSAAASWPRRPPPADPGRPTPRPLARGSGRRDFTPLAEASDRDVPVAARQRDQAAALDQRRQGLAQGGARDPQLAGEVSL